MGSNEDKLGDLPRKSSRGVSVGKDIDGLLASMSVETCLSLPESAKKIINTKTENGADEMREAAIDLMIHIYKNFPERLSNLNCPELSGLDFKKPNTDDSELIHIMKKCVRNNFNLEQFGAGKAYDLYLAFKINTPRNNSEPLSPAWNAASNKYNVPKEFAANYRDTVKEEGNILSFRLDEKIKNIVKRDSACKPSYIWYKVGNWGPFENIIPADQNNFAKTNDAGVVVHGAHTKVTEHPEKYPNLIGTKQVPYTLQEVLDGLKTGKYSIDKSMTNDDRLCFRPVPGVHNNPKESKAVFAIPMNGSREPMASDVYHSISSNEACLNALNKNEHFPWNEKWGSKEDAMRCEFNLQADTAGTGDGFKDLMQINIPTANNSNAKHVFSYVQHSFECYNPFIQSNVNGLGLHAGPPDGEPIIKQDFKGHTKFYAEHGKDQVMHINQHWDMNKDLCGQLVLNQINLVSEHLTGSKSPVTIDLNTFNNFVKTLATSPTPLSQSDFQSAVNVANNFGEKGVTARISLCNHLAEATKASDLPPYRREAVNNLLSHLKNDKVADNNNDTNPAADAIKNLQNVTAEKRAHISADELVKENKQTKTAASEEKTNAVESHPEEQTESRMRPS